MSDSEDDQADTPEQLNEDGEEYTSDEGVDPTLDIDKKAERLTAADLAEADILFGFRVVSSMTESHLDTLINKLEANCSLHDTISVFMRIKRMDWEKIAFEPYTAEECRVAWLYLKNQTRKFRIMAEVVQEIKIASENDPERFRSRLIETAPGFPKRPPATAAALFCREMWKANPEKQHLNFLVFQRECLEGFHKLDEVKQENWKNKLESAVADYQKQVTEFYSQYPNYTYVEKGHRRGWRIISKKATPSKKVRREKGTPRPRVTTVSEQSEHFPGAPKPPSNPQGEFVQSKLSQLETIPEGSELSELKAKYTNKWQKLSSKKKAKWIMQVLEKVHAYMEDLRIYQEKHPNYVTRPVKLRNHLSKSDIENWAYINGQPEKPARSVFESFYREKCAHPDYADLSTEESRKYAEEEFKNLDSYDKEMCKINFRRSVLDYKKNIERFFDWTPDILKPHILYNIPKKFRPVVMTHVEKLPESMLLEEEEKAELMLQEEAENEDEQEHYSEEDAVEIPRSSKKRKKNREPEIQSAKSEESSSKKKNTQREENVELLESPSPKKHKKKKKHRNDDDDDDIIEYVDMDNILNGNQASTKHAKNVPHEKSNEVKVKLPKKPLVKPAAADYSKGRLSTSQDIDDVIRGIFDARPHLGRNYSVFYFYAKYVAREKVWVTHVDASGLIVTAERIIGTFFELSTLKKEIFISQSWERHLQTSHMEPLGNLMPGEPTPPPKNAQLVFKREVDLIKKRKDGRTTPKWGEISEQKQQLYIKRLYRDTKEYAKAYEEYIMKLSPEELSAYTIFQSQQWERRKLSTRSLRAAWRGFIFPLPTDLFSEDELGGDSDPEILDNTTFRERQKSRNIYKRLPSLLDNDDLIRNITTKVTPEEPTMEELMADTSSSSSSDED